MAKKSLLVACVGLMGLALMAGASRAGEQSEGADSKELRRVSLSRGSEPTAILVALGLRSAAEDTCGTRRCETLSNCDPGCGSCSNGVCKK